MAYRRGRQGLRLQNQRTAIPVNLLKISDSCSGRTQSTLPQISKMNHMMFFLFLIVSPCMAVNLSPNKAYTLANHTASWLNLITPCWICISSISWGLCATYPRVSVAHPSSPATCYHPMHHIWPWFGLLGKRGRKLHALVSATAVCIYSHDNICNPSQALIFSLD